jgi:FkbM family methyltransferase
MNMRGIVKATAMNIRKIVKAIVLGNLPLAARLHGLVQAAHLHVASGPEPKAALMRVFGISCVLDVGANSGQFGRKLRLAGYNGRIVSFEPVSGPYRQLAEVAKRDGQWCTAQLALGDRAESATIHVSSVSTFSSLLAQTSFCVENHPGAKPVADQVVSVKRLDDVFRDYVRADDQVLLKIDTQGFERAVLDGASAVLPHIQGVYLEVSFKAMYQGEATAAEMIERLARDGFTLVLLEPLPNMLESVEQITQADALFLRLPLKT